MAINYNKVGWDTTKYFNPSNMNHMDDGIKAACDKADANEKAIEQANSNFSNISISSDIGEIITDLNGAIGEKTRVYIGVISSNALNIPYAGYGILLQARINGSNDITHVEQIAFMNNGTIYHRSKINSVWENWTQK